MQARTLIIGLALLLPATVFADFTGRVVGVSDGDPITVLHNGRGEKIRLNGIDCPERRQAFGNRAKQATSDLSFKLEVTVIEHGRRSTPRASCIVNCIPD